MTRETVKFINAALDEDPQGNIILRGVLSTESFDLLKVAPYQREILPTARINALVKAFENSSVPDIDLGMRGGGFIEKDGTFYLQDETYVIDGLQRLTAAKRSLSAGSSPRLGGIVYFNTTEKWERDRFRVLNTLNIKLSPSVLIRNMEDDFSSIELLRTLSKDSTFVLGGKICWDQRMKRGELISGKTLLYCTARLHAQHFSGMRADTRDSIVPTFQKMYDKYGRTMVKENIRAFWELIDDCFKVRSVTFREGAAYLKLGFLFAFTNLLADHQNFWKDSRLSVERDLRKKIASFPINDPEVMRLAGAGGPAQHILYEYLLKHINSGKRTKRLIPKKQPKES